MVLFSWYYAISIYSILSYLDSSIFNKSYCFQGLRHPWDGHDDHSHGHGHEHEVLNQNHFFFAGIIAHV